MPKLDERGVIQFVVVFILLAGLIAGVYLVQRTQIFKPKAAPNLPANPEISFELELEQTATSLFPDEATPTYITNGTNFRVDVYARSDIEAANLFNAKIRYSADTLEFVEVNQRSGQSFIRNWVEASNDNDVVSMVGGVPAPGVQTNTQIGAYLMGSIIFRTKATGTAAIELVDTSAIYSNSNNINILTARKGAIAVPIQQVQSTPTPTPAPQISCSRITVEGGIQVNNNSGELTYYVVDGEARVRLSAQVNPASSNIIWVEASRSQYLPAGRFDTPNSTSTFYTVPRNANSNQQEGVTIRADIPNSNTSQNPLASCPNVTLAINPTSANTRSVSYNLSPNWNLIGIPVTPTAALTAETFLKNSTYGNNKCDTIIGFDSSSGQARSYFTDPSKSIFNNLSNLTAGRGYFVHCTEAISFSLSGNSVSSNPTVVVDWNQVSLPLGTNMRASEVLAQLSGSLSCQTIWTIPAGANQNSCGGYETQLCFTNGGSSCSYQVPDPQNSSACNRTISSTNFSVNDTTGYWVHCVAQSQLTPGSGDANNDSRIDLGDMSVLLSDFNKNSGFRRALDMNGDGVINTFDFSLMRNLLITSRVIRG